MTCDTCGREYIRADAYDGDLCPYGCEPTYEDDEGDEDD